MKLSNMQKIGVLVFFLSCFFLFYSYQNVKGPIKQSQAAEQSERAQLSKAINGDSMVKAHVIEGINMAGIAKDKVTEAAMVDNALPANQTATGYVSPPPTSFVQSITIRAIGVIIIKYTPAAGDGTIILTPTLMPEGSMLWNCNGGTLANKYRPASCLGGPM